MADQVLSQDLAVDEEASRIQKAQTRRHRVGTVIRYGVLTLVGLLMLYPLIWLVGASFKPNSEIFSGAGFIPDAPTVAGYVNGWQTSTPYTFGRFFWNTFLIVIPKIIGTAISCTAVAYGFARFDFPGKKILFASLIATLLLPNVVTRIPQYLLFRDLGWLDTYLPLWVPSAFAGDAFFVFMLVQFLRAIPRDMEEAGSTIVFVTHDQWEAMTLATTIAVMSEGELQQVGTPDDIYERPANRFVAEFVGSLPINIIERAEGQSGPLNAWLDHLLAHFGVDGAAVASAGIRPEATRVGALFAEDAAKRAAGQGIVVDIVPTGGSWIVELDVQGSRVFAIVTENPRIAAGQSSHFWVERQHLHLFDREKRRITA